VTDDGMIVDKRGSPNPAQGRTNVDGTVVLGLAGIGATLMAGLVGASTVLVVAHWQRQDARRDRFADARRVAYVGFLARLDELETMVLARRNSPPKPGGEGIPHDLANRFLHAVAEVHLVGPVELRDAMVTTVHTAMELSKAASLPDSDYTAARAAEATARAAFTFAARRDLGVPD
jgi:hypothetical protein